MAPKVRIVETAPASDDYLVRGTIAKDVTLDCLVEDLLTDKQVCILLQCNPHFMVTFYKRIVDRARFGCYAGCH